MFQQPKYIFLLVPTANRQSRNHLCTLHLQISWDLKEPKIILYAVWTLIHGSPGQSKLCFQDVAMNKSTNFNITFLRKNQCVDTVLWYYLLKTFQFFSITLDWFWRTLMTSQKLICPGLAPLTHLIKGSWGRHWYISCEYYWVLVELIQKFRLRICVIQLSSCLANYCSC